MRDWWMWSQKTTPGVSVGMNVMFVNFSCHLINCKLAWNTVTFNNIGNKLTGTSTGTKLAFQQC